MKQTRTTTFSRFHDCADHPKCAGCPKLSDCHCPGKPGGNPEFGGHRSFWTKEKAVSLGWIDVPDAGIVRVKAEGRITSVVLAEKYRCIEPCTIDFRPGVNLLVGDQGSGKSSLLGLMFAQGQAHSSLNGKCKIVTIGSVAVRKFDFEKDNPRIQREFSSNILADYTAMTVSHGQAALGILRGAGKHATGEPTVFLLDEPDMALSGRSVMVLTQLFKDLAAAGYQIVASIHHPWVIEAFDQVFDMESTKWVGSKDYLARMRQTV